MGTIYLIRHGQASFGSDDYDRLSELGFRQADALGRALAPRVPAIDLVVTGAMRRHRETATTCLAAMGQATSAPVEDAGWNEYDHEAVLGAHEPLYRDRAAWSASLGPDPGESMRRLFAGALARWIDGSLGGVPETWREFRARTDAALDALMARVVRGQTALVFTSGGPISTVASGLLRVPDDARLHIAAQLVNAGVTKLVFGARGLRLSTLNDHAHLDADPRALRTYV